MYRQGHSVEEALALIAEMPEQSPELDAFCRSIKESNRGIVR